MLIYFRISFIHFYAIKKPIILFFNTYFNLSLSISFNFFSLLILFLSLLSFYLHILLLIYLPIFLSFTPFSLSLFLLHPYFSPSLFPTLPWFNLVAPWRPKHNISDFISISLIVDLYNLDLHIIWQPQTK